MNAILRQLLLIFLLVGGCLMIALPAQVQAKDLFADQCSRTDTDGSAVCTDNASTDPDRDPLSGKDGLFIKMTNVVAIVGGAAAVIMILVNAIGFVTSGSDVSTGSRHDADVENARRGIANAVIGLIVIVAARSIILFFLSKVK